jgi:hypothetical protein
MKEEDSNKKKEERSDFYQVFIQGQDYKNIITKRSIWERLAETYNGKLSVSKTIRKDIVLFRLRLTYRDFKILVIETDTKPLKFEISINLKIESEFEVYWEDNFEKLFKLFGKKDIQIGSPEFDKKYMVQSNQDMLITDLLNYKDINKTLFKHNIYSFSSEKNKDNNLHQIITTKDRNTNDYEAMAEIIEMQFAVIDFFYKEELVVQL